MLPATPIPPTTTRAPLVVEVAATLVVTLTTFPLITILLASVWLVAPDVVGVVVWNTMLPGCAEPVLTPPLMIVQPPVLSVPTPDPGVIVTFPPVGAEPPTILITPPSVFPVAPPLPATSPTAPPCSLSPFAPSSPTIKKLFEALRFPPAVIFPSTVNEVNVPTLVMFGCAAVVTVPAVVAVPALVAEPLNVAVIILALKLPFASLATTLFAVLVVVASTVAVTAVPPLKLVPVK